VVYKRGCNGHLQWGEGVWRPGLPRGGRRGARNQQDARPAEAGDSQLGVAARAGRKQGRGTRGLARGEGRTTGPMKNSDISELFKVFYI
jgi:hypothetical protein